MSDFKDCSIVVPAAGKGQRMGVDVSKQYLKVCGETILHHTLNQLLALQPARIILVVSHDDDSWKEVVLTQQCEIVIGGVTRADSVLNGLKAALTDQTLSRDHWVLVHDCARPCISQVALNRLFASVKDSTSGGILALPIVDTLKHVDAELAGPTILSTVPRDEYYLAQTPQMFPCQALHDALTHAQQAGFDVTDEASAMEYAGFKPLIVLGEKRNLKVTTQEDLALAEYYLSSSISPQPVNG